MNNHSRSDLSQGTAEGHSALDQFQLSPDLIYLNHGGYGAIPKAVSVERARLLALVEANPTGFFADILPGELRRLAAVAAQRFGGHGDDWVFCENATAAINSVLASLALREGDEVLTTSHAYGAVLKAMRGWAARRGANLVVADIPAIIESEDQIIEAIRAKLSSRTKLLVVDHITSATAMVFPVAQIAAMAHAAGIPVLVDGAHAPGQVPVNVEAIGADWYTGNAHKWLFAPRGCGLLWTAPEHRGRTLPVVLSHGSPDGYASAFDWIGTRDVTPWLCFDFAAVQHDRFGGAHLMIRNRALAAQAAAILEKSLGLTPSAPESMRAAMAAMVIGRVAPGTDPAPALRRGLTEQFGIVAPVFAFEKKLWLRISAQIYNQLGDYERLAAVIPQMLTGGGSR